MCNSMRNILRMSSYLFAESYVHGHVSVIKLLLIWAGVFLEALEPYILKDMLGSLPPEVSNTEDILVLAHKFANGYILMPIWFVDHASSSRAL